MPDSDIVLLLERAAKDLMDHRLYCDDVSDKEDERILEVQNGLTALARRWRVYETARELAEDYEGWVSGRIVRTNQALLSAYRAAKAAAESTAE